MINEKQKMFLGALNDIKDFNIGYFISFLHSNAKLSDVENKEAFKWLQSKFKTKEDITCFQEVQKEIIDSIITDILVLIDGYGKLEFDIDIIDRETKQSLREGIELHDSYYNYQTESDVEV